MFWECIINDRSDLKYNSLEVMTHGPVTVAVYASASVNEMGRRILQALHALQALP